MPYTGKDLTAAQLYGQILRGTKIGDVFSVSIRRVAERLAVNALIDSSEECELVHFGINDVQLKRIA